MVIAGSRRVALVGVLLLGLTAMPAAPSFATEVAPPDTVLTTIEDLSASTEAHAEGVEVSEPLDTERPFSMIGFTLTDGVETADVRVRGLDGTWGPWQELEVGVVGVDGPDVGSDEARQASSNVTDPIWVGAADGFEVRIAGELAEIEATLIDTEGLGEGLVAKAARHLQPRIVTPDAEASSDRPAVISRQQWGANEALRKGSPRYAAPTFMVLHHTAGSNTYRRDQSAGIMRGIYSYHTQTRGWADIGYNVLVDKYGQIFEGRFGGLDRGVIGAHAAGFNTGSFGVSVIGNYDVVKAPQVAVDAVARVAAWKYGVHDIDPGPTARVNSGGRSLNVMTAHRDVGSTACPGRHLYAAMDGLRAQVATLAAAPTTSPTATGDGPTPVPGDWNGDGRTQTGWFDDGTWVLPSGPSGATQRFVYGQAGDTPVVGDWNGDGKDGIGVRRVGRWRLRNTPTPGPDELNFINGYGTDLPVTGDWNGDGRDGVGVYRDGRWRLRQTASGGDPDLDFVFGGAGDRPITGDWNGDGRDGIGHVQGAQWSLSERAAPGTATHEFAFARVDDHRVSGDFNLDGRDTVGVVRGDGWLISTAMPAQPADYVLRFSFESAMLPEPEPEPETEPETTPAPSPAPPPSPAPDQLLTWHLKFVNAGGVADEHARMGRSGDRVLACDFNGDGRDTPASFRDGRWTVSNDRGGGGTLVSFAFGRSGDRPLCGDWNGDGRATVAVERSGTWFFKDRLESGVADHTARYGRVASQDHAIVGDWNGNGRDTLGIIRDGQWHLRNDLFGGPGTISFSYGRILRGDLPLVGDWNGDGRDGVGIVRGGEWHLRNDLSGGPAQSVFAYGRVNTGDVPVVGDWNGDGRSSAGIVR